MENSVVPSKEMEAKQPANPESGEAHKEPEETGNEHVIFICSDIFQGTLRNLMGSDASVQEEDEEEDEGPLIGQVTGFLGMKSKLNKYFQPCIMSIGPLRRDKNKSKQGQQFKSQRTKRQKNVTAIEQLSRLKKLTKKPTIILEDSDDDYDEFDDEFDDEYSSNKNDESSRDDPISVTFEERLRKLMDPDAWAKELEHEFKVREAQYAGAYCMAGWPYVDYTRPRTMSIGPLGFDNCGLGRLFKHELAKRFINENMSQSAKTLYNDILKEIAVFKKCYDEQELNKYNKDDHELAWNFFVDGCALIHFVKCYYNCYECFEFYDINIRDDQIKHVVTDFFLVKNQIPFGVLNLVMGFCERESLRMSIHRLVKEIVQMIHFEGRAKDEKADRTTGQSFNGANQIFNGANHLLELIWMNLVKKKNDNRFDKTKAIPRQFRSVKDLQAAGIKLEPDNSSSSLRDISFNRGIFFCKLKIPRFRVSEEGMFLVFNLIAFEMRPHFGKDRVVTSYISFLSSLLTTEEDVAELRKVGILFNYLPNDNAVLKTFQDLTSSMKPYSDIFSDIKEELIDYFNDKKSMTTGKWLSEVMHVYFRSPWTIIAFVSATILLILTIIQTIFSVLSYAQYK